MARDQKREFLLTEVEAELLDVAVSAAGVSRSDYIRGAVIDRMIREGWSRFLFPALSVRELTELYPTKSAREIAAMVEHLEPGPDEKEE